MPWAKFDDAFPDHPKLKTLPGARVEMGWIQVVSVCYASRFGTDGFLQKTIVESFFDDHFPMLIPGDRKRILENMLALNIWHEVSSDSTITCFSCNAQRKEKQAKAIGNGEEGYLVHDFLVYNPSVWERNAGKAEREMKARTAANARWRK